MSILPTYSVMTEHFREAENIDQEIVFIEEKRELAYYQRFLNSLDAGSLEDAERNAQEILENKDFSSNLKLYTILSAGQIIFISNLNESLKLDKYTATLVWQVDALQKYACNTKNVHPVVKYTTDLMGCILQIQLIAQSILDQRVKAYAFGERTENPIAMLSASLIYAFESSAFGSLKDAIDEFNKLVKEQQDFQVQFRAMGLTAPMLIHAFIPLRQAFVLADEKEKVKTLEDYAFNVLKTHAIICEFLSDKYHLQRNLFSLFALRFNIKGEPDFSPALGIISSIGSESFKKVAQEIYNDLVKSYSKVLKSEDSTDEMQVRKSSAMMLARMEGYDLEKKSEEIGYKDELHKRIHDILKKGIEELDLTEYLKDCQYRHIFLPEFSGISEVADSFGLGFAAARKGVMCLKKGVFGSSVSYYLSDTFKAFYNQHCKGCLEIKSHLKDWKYTYKWQMQEDEIYEKFLSERRKGT